MVAVPFVRMVQVTINEVVDVIAVGDCGVSATGTMNVIGRVTWHDQTLQMWIAAFLTEDEATEPGG